jgi:hypothetical protein
MQSDESRSPEVPKWVALLVLLICLVVGGLFVWRLAGKEAKPLAAERAEPVAAAPARAAPTNNSQPPNADIQVNPNGGRFSEMKTGGQPATRPTSNPAVNPWQAANTFKPGVVQTERVVVICRPMDLMIVRAGDRPATTLLTFHRPTDAERERQYGEAAASAAQFDAVEQKRLKLSEQQIADLKNLPPRWMMMQKQYQPEGLTELFEAYEKADGEAKAQAEKTLLAKVKEAGEAVVQSQRNAQDPRFAKLQQILTAEQLRSVLARMKDPVRNLGIRLMDQYYLPESKEGVFTLVDTRVWTTTASMNATKGPFPTKFTFTLMGRVNPDAAQIAGVIQVLDDPSVAEKLKLSKEQTDKLAALPVFDAQPDAPTRAPIVAAYEAYDAADGEAKEKAKEQLIAAVDAYGKAAGTRYDEFQKTQAQQVREILGEDLLAQAQKERQVQIDQQIKRFKEQTDRMAEQMKNAN